MIVVAARASTQVASEEAAHEREPIEYEQFAILALDSHAEGSVHDHTLLSETYGTRMSSFPSVRINPGRPEERASASAAEPLPAECRHCDRPRHRAEHCGSDQSGAAATGPASLGDPRTPDRSCVDASIRGDAVARGGDQIDSQRMALLARRGLGRAGEHRCFCPTPTASGGADRVGSCLLASERGSARSIGGGAALPGGAGDCAG